MSLLEGQTMIDLTEPWSSDSWAYPGHPRPREDVLQSFSEHGINSWVIATSMHTGTHVDGPLHCTEHGDDLASIPLERLVRPGYVVDLTDVATPWHVVTPAEIEERLPAELEPGDALVLRYGWLRFCKGHEQEDADMYFNRHPGPGTALVDWLEAREVAWVGTDAASFEHPANVGLAERRPDLAGEIAAAVGDAETFDRSTWMVAHRRMLARGQLHVDQVGGEVDAVPAGRVTLGLFPWRYRGGEASICRVVAFCPTP